MTPTEYLRIALLVVVVLLFPLGYLKGCSDEKGRFDAFKGTVEAAGKAQLERTTKQTADDKKRKEKADEEHARAIADLNRRLRDARSRPVSAPASCPSSPDGAGRYRAEFDGAYRDLVAGLRAEAERCSKAVIDLNTGKLWAQ